MYTFLSNFLDGLSMVFQLNLVYQLSVNYSVCEKGFMWHKKVSLFSVYMSFVNWRYLKL